MSFKDHFAELVVKAKVREEHGLEPEAVGARTDRGNWSRPGVPHKGWVCIDVYDVGSDLYTCEMCEFAQVRFVHVMTNERWPEQLSVGCHCAGRMEEDAAAAVEREHRLKSRLRNPGREADRTIVEA